MAFSSIRDVSEGAIISFRTKNPNDTVNWQGTLEAIGTLRAVQTYGNPAPYNEAVRQSDPSVPSDLSSLTYFLITVDNDSTSPTLSVFADEWILPGSLNEISLGNQVKLLVDDPKKDTQAILSLLASAGYACRLIS